MTIKCIAFGTMTDPTPASVLIFGRIARITQTAPKDYIKQCTAEDQHGNKYAIFTDYDGCLVGSDAVAVPIK